MSNKKDKVMLVEHVLEVRHEASGNFLDVRGRIADYFKKEKLFPHWQIDSNVVNFRDKDTKIEKEGAFVGYKSYGYIVLDAVTRNYFVDRTELFLKLLSKYEAYRPANYTRFGARTKFFIPTDLSFEEISELMFKGVFTEKMLNLVGGKKSDLQFILELKDNGSDVRIVGGPMHSDEARKLMQFESEEFSKAGLFLDIDFSKTSDLDETTIPKLLKASVSSTWAKAEQIASGLGL